MTAKEAIKTLKLAKAEVEWEYPMDIAVAIDKAIEALEKQIPKKPLYGNSWNQRKCPVCGLLLNWIGYPCRCGQMIDWSEVE